MTLAIFGDGATDMGEFHESLNLASVWKLPVVFLCENNLYAMGTPIAETTAASSIAEKAAGYNMLTKRVNGQDVLEMYRECAGGLRPCASGQRAGAARGDDLSLSAATPPSIRSSTAPRRRCWSGRPPIR